MYVYTHIHRSTHENTVEYFLILLHSIFDGIFVQLEAFQLPCVRGKEESLQVFVSKLHWPQIISPAPFFT